MQRERKDMLCVNPLTGTKDGSAPAEANPGTLVPTADLSGATLVQGKVGAHCDKGLLMLDGEIPPLGPFVLPGNNYHVYDYALFWGCDQGGCGAEAGGVAAPLITTSVSEFEPRFQAASLQGSTSERRRLASPFAIPDGALPGPSRLFVERSSRRTLIDYGRSLSEQSVQGLIVGLPLNMDGSDLPADTIGPRLRQQPRASRSSPSCSGTNGGPRRRSSVQ